MSNKQTTSIEWLYEELTNNFFNIKKSKEVLEQAKEMDKEQKQNMFDCGRQYQLTGEGTFKEVYEEIYGDK